MRTKLPTFIFVLVLVTLGVYQAVREMYAPYWEDLTELSFGVLSGTSKWLAFQNRLLGPVLVGLLKLTGISNITALKLFVLLVLLIQNFLLFYLFIYSKASKKEGLSAVLIFSLMFLFIQEYRLYVWDFVDILIFTLFAWGIFNKKSLRYFLPLFLIAIFNRESALFISLYIVIDSFDDETPFLKNFKLQSKQQFIFGVLLTIIGLLIIVSIRNLSILDQPKYFTGQWQDWYGNHFHLFKNLYALFIGNFSDFHILNSTFLLGSLAYVVSFITRQWKAVLIYIVMLTNILIFGIVNETRLYAILLPFLVFFIHQPGNFLSNEPPIEGNSGMLE